MVCKDAAVNTVNKKMQDLKKDLLLRGRPHQRRPSHGLSWRSRLLRGQVSVAETLGQAWPAGTFAVKLSRLTQLFTLFIK